MVSVGLLSIAVSLSVKCYQVVEENLKLQEEKILDRTTYTNDLSEIIFRFDAEVRKNKELVDKQVQLENELVKVRKKSS
ncbi:MULTISPECIES: hypothetical protein [Flavobacterium]|uniref:Uncharacterized protein n=3 Tax=Flavobacterium TaxID=237 RepID=A0AA94F1E3_9FLAO|nr:MULTISPECIES: hypothetical protein [Flavobacterium]MCH4829604.1 hypothetical protein [Flavobacterium columnare]MCH4831399.1 hypothetical protein [Flavobacterium columnare]MCJ1807544.1 hypothetical protein [Flavobacterium covae]MCJ1808533.1 hypothetical protein [Flavobacterium covae]QYS91846.1 hypothetical protein JJC04_03960 [Flavobacterium covae]